MTRSLAEEKPFDVLCWTSMPGISAPRLRRNCSGEGRNWRLWCLRCMQTSTIRENCSESVRYVQEVDGQRLDRAIRAAHRANITLIHRPDFDFAYVGRPTGKNMAGSRFLLPARWRFASILHTAIPIRRLRAVVIRTHGGAHRNNIMTKLGFESRADLVHWHDNGL